MTETRDSSNDFWFNNKKHKTGERIIRDIVTELADIIVLQAFSDDFKRVVSDTSMYQQAGNSIVVDVLIHIVEQIIKSYPDFVS